MATMTETTQTVAPSESQTAKPEEKPPPLLAGHIGYLSDQQKKALDELRSLIQAEDGPQSSSETKEGNPLYSDITYVRYLRARRFDVQAALAQFKRTESWRKANDMDGLYEHYDIAEFERVKAFYPQWTGRRDKLGFPLYVYDLSSEGMVPFARELTTAFDASAHSAKASPQLHSLFVLSEYVFRFVQPLCSSVADRPHQQRPITSTTNVIDLSGVGLKQFWVLKTHLQQASVLANTHYPEAVERIFIVGAPAIVPFFWNLIKNWFDPVTTAKIFILSASQVTPTLTEHIDPANIPRKYGGKLDWEFGKPSQLDEQTHSLFWGSEQGTRDYVEGPILWGPDTITSPPRAVAMGSMDGNERRRVIGAPLTPNRSDA